MKKFSQEIVSPMTLVALICGIIAIATGLYAILFLPHENEVKSLGIFLFKLLPFIFGTISIAHIKREYCTFLVKKNIAYIGFVLAFLVYFAFIIPMIFTKPEMTYYYTLMEVPYIILFLSFVFRMGGASNYSTMRFSFSLLTVMLSGIEDLIYCLINIRITPGFNMPEVWDWASHMKVRIGHYPTKIEAYIFIAFHLILATLIIFVPWSKTKPFMWVEKRIKGIFKKETEKYVKSPAKV